MLKFVTDFFSSSHYNMCLFRFFFFLLSTQSRLKEHLLMNKRETLRQLKNSIAPCQPLYNLFDVNRHLFCHHIIDPLNGLWFSSFVSLMIWAILTPIALGLATVYTDMTNSRGLIRSSSHQ